MLGYGFPNDTRGFVLTSDQDAFVHVAIVRVKADSDDAAVIHLLVVQRQGERRVVRDTRDRPFVKMEGLACGGGD